MEKIFELLGISGDLCEIINNKNYQTIRFGEEFESLCDLLDLDSEAVRKYIIEFALYEIYKENCSFNSNDLKLMKKYEEEKVGSYLTLGEAIDRNFLSVENFYESLGYLLNNQVGEAKDKEREKIIKSICTNDFFIKREGAVFLAYKDRQKRYRQPFNKEPDKINLLKDINKFKENTILYLNLLGKTTDLNYTEDLISFENETNLLFIFNLYNAVYEYYADNENNDDNEYYDVFLNNEAELYNLAASLVIIENPALKIYLANNLVKEGTILDLLKNRNVYLRKLYSVGLVFPALIRKYLESKIHLHVKNTGLLKLNEVDNEVSDKVELKQLKEIKEKVYISELLQNRGFIDLIDIKGNIESIDVLERGLLFKSLYTKVSTIKHSKMLILDVFSNILNKTINDLSVKRNLDNKDLESLLGDPAFVAKEAVILNWRKEREKNESAT